jgi:hypothetical protein
MLFRSCSCCHHLPHMQQQHRGGLLGGFNPIHAVSTSLTCKSEIKVGLWPFDPFTSLPPPSQARVRWRWVLCLFNLFVLLPPPSHATVRRRWVLCCFNPFHITTTFLACKSEMEVVCMAFQPCSCWRHFPHIQQ